MSALTKGEIEVKQAELIQRLMDDDFNALTREQQAKELGVARRTLIGWINDPDLIPWDKINERRSRAVWQHKPKIDAALVAKASKGNIGAVELYYKFQLGLSEKTIQETILKNGDIGAGKDTAELMAEAIGSYASQMDKAMKYMSPEQRGSLRYAVLNFKEPEETTAEVVKDSAIPALEGIRKWEEEEKMRRLGISPEKSRPEPM